MNENGRTLRIRKPDGRVAYRLESPHEPGEIDEPEGEVLEEISSNTLGVDVDFDALIDKKKKLERKMLSPFQVNTLMDRLESVLFESFSEVDNEERRLSSHDAQELTTQFFREKILREIVRDIRMERLFNDELQGIFDLSHLPDFEKYIRSHPYIQEDYSLVWSGFISGTADTDGKVNLNPGLVWTKGSPYEMSRTLANVGLPSPAVTLIHELVHREQFQHTPKKTETSEESLPEESVEWQRAFKRLKEFAPVLAGLGLLGLPDHPFATVFSSLSLALVLFADSGARIVAEDFGLWKKTVVEKSLIREVHAHSTHKQFEDVPYSTRDLLGIRRNYPTFFLQPKDHFVMAFTEIERLRALGVSHKRIAELVEKSEWSDEVVGYDQLEQEVERVAQEKGLTMPQVDTLNDARRLQREVNILSARRIAQKRIVQACKEWQVPAEDIHTLTKSSYRDAAGMS